MKEERTYKKIPLPPKEKYNYGRSSIFHIPFFVRCTACLMTSVLLLNAIGYYPLFKLRQWQVHTEIKTLICQSAANSQLECISISPQNSQDIQWEWEWENDNKEFTYQGNRYDVVRSQTNGPIIHYFCIKDSQETKLFAELDKEVKKQMNDEKNPLRSTTKKLMKTFSLPPSVTHHTIEPQKEIHSGKQYSLHSCLYCCDFFNRISPPPKQA